MATYRDLSSAERLLGFFMSLRRLILASVSGGMGTRLRGWRVNVYLSTYIGSYVKIFYYIPPWLIFNEA